MAATFPIALDGIPAMTYFFTVARLTPDQQNAVIDTEGMKSKAIFMALRVEDIK